MLACCVRRQLDVWGDRLSPNTRPQPDTFLAFPPGLLERVRLRGRSAKVAERVSGTKDPATIVSMVKVPVAAGFDHLAAADAKREPGSDEGFERSTTLASR